jgi:cobalt-zinc-cadmium efflux system membrane fusion protein
LGAQVDPDTILFRVIDPAQLVVRADVPESMANRIRLGSLVEVRLPTHGTACAANIVSSTRSVDPIKRTVSFRIKPHDGCPGMLEGGFADVQIPLDVGVPQPVAAASAKPSGSPSSTPRATAPGVVPQALEGPQLVALPRSAVVELDSVPIVFVATELQGQFRVVALTVARHTETTTWVEQGLVGGERVASRGALLLKGELMKSRLE